MEENETQTPASDTDINMVGVIQDRKFIPYGMTGIRGGIPVYVFNTYADYEAAAPTLPETCMFITLDDLDTGGFEFDSELSETSENAVQNKIITAALRKKAGFDSPGAVQFTDSTAVTERDSGLGLSAIEKNAAVDGTLAHEIGKVKEKADGIVGITGEYLFQGDCNDIPIGCCAYAYSNTQNAPTDEGGWYVFSCGIASSYMFQIGIKENKFAFRQKLENVWKTWVNVQVS